MGVVTWDMAHPRPIDKEFEDADDTGVLVLSGRNLRSFPLIPGELCNLNDVFEAGELYVVCVCVRVRASCIVYVTVCCVCWSCCMYQCRANNCGRSR